MAINFITVFVALLILTQSRACMCQNTGPAQGIDDRTNTTQTTRIVLVGDSTMNRSTGWGTGFCDDLTGDVECFNMSKNGRSSKSYRAEGWWDRAIALRPTYVLIQLGGNDIPGKGPDRETDPKTTYYANMKQYVLDARASGAKPVLVTSMPRRNYKNGKYLHDMEAYAAAVRKVGDDTGTPVIDLNARAIAYLDSITEQQSSPYDYMTSSTAKPDHGHMSLKGSVLFGGYVAESFAQVVPVMAKHVHIQPAP